MVYGSAAPRDWILLDVRGLIRGPERRLFSLMNNMRIGGQLPAVEKVTWNFDVPG